MNNREFLNLNSNPRNDLPPPCYRDCHEKANWPDAYRIAMISDILMNGHETRLLVSLIGWPIREKWVLLEHVMLTPRLRRQIAVCKKRKVEKLRQEKEAKSRPKEAAESTLPSTSTPIQQRAPPSFSQSFDWFQQQQQQQYPVYPVGYPLRPPQYPMPFNGWFPGPQQLFPGPFNQQVPASRSCDFQAMKFEQSLTSPATSSSGTLAGQPVAGHTSSSDLGLLKPAPFNPQPGQVTGRTGPSTSCDCMAIKAEPANLQSVAATSSCDLAMPRPPPPPYSTVQSTAQVTVKVRPGPPINPQLLQLDEKWKQPYPIKQNLPPPPDLKKENEAKIITYEPLTPWIEQRSNSPVQFAEMPLQQLAAAMISPSGVYQKLYGKRPCPSPVDSAKTEDRDVIFERITGPTPRKTPKLKEEPKSETIGTDLGSFNDDEVLCLGEGTKADLSAMDWDAYFSAQGPLKPKSETQSDHSSEPRLGVPSMDTMWMETFMPLEGKVDTSFASSSSEPPPMLSPGMCMITESGRAWSPAPTKEDKEDLAHLEGLTRDC